ncbi:recombinase family protein [Sinomonas sp. G460-2]|uniref:recombinase family protein n=1 Tax=Sinomonas sp. G460-2 TaxID=3393464 RepID=UPI0039EFFAA9
MNRAAVYVRISDDKAGGGLGVKRQEDDCRRLAESLGFEHVVVYTDNDVSAYSGRRRPQYEAMLEQVVAGLFSAVIAWHGDRLHRSPVELEKYIDTVEKHGVETLLVTGGRVDLSTPTGRMIARTVGNMARYESEHKAERITRAHRQAAEQGRWRGGARPFGYEGDAKTPHPLEAQLVREAYRAIINGTSLGEVCRTWNAAGVRTTTGRNWCIQSLKQLVLRERNYGASLYKGNVVGTGAWEPIIDEATFKKARIVLTDPARRRSHSTRARWLIAGLGKCGICEAEGKSSTVRSATTRSRGRAWTIYKCKTGGHLARKAVDTDLLVERTLFAYLSRPDNRQAIADRTPARAGNPDSAQREEDLMRRLQDAKDLWLEGILSVEELRSVKVEVEQHLASLTSARASHDARPVVSMLQDAADLRAVWDALSIDVRKTVIDALMTVTIMPVPRGRQRRFQEDLIRIDWKSGS